MNATGTGSAVTAAGVAGACAVVAIAYLHEYPGPVNSLAWFPVTIPGFPLL